MESWPEPQLRSLLGDEGWTVERLDDQGVLRLKRGGTTTVLAVSEVANTAWDFVRGAFADAALRARYARNPRSKQMPIAIVIGPKISDKLAGRLRVYRDTYAPDVGWGVFDRDGKLDLWGDVEIHVAPERRKRGASPRKVSVWSDLGRWVMKVLVMHTIAPDEARWMPTVRGASNAELTRILAGIGGRASVSQVWQVTAQLKREGFLDEDNTVLRADELLERWRHRQAPAEVHPMSWVLAGGDTRERLRPLVASGAGRACLAGFSACREHRIAIAATGVTEVYLRHLDLAKEVKLTETLAGEKPDVSVRIPDAPESVFRGVAQASDGTMYADLIQCWLDLVDLSAQGQKQADAIWKRRFHFS